MEKELWSVIKSEETQKKLSQQEEATTHRFFIVNVYKTCEQVDATTTPVVLLFPGVTLRNATFYSFVSLLFNFCFSV